LVFSADRQSFVGDGATVNGVTEETAEPGPTDGCGNAVHYSGMRRIAVVGYGDREYSEGKLALLGSLLRDEHGAVEELFSFQNVIALQRTLRKDHAVSFLVGLQGLDHRAH